MEDKQLTVIEHFSELRKRLMIIAIAVIIGTILSYKYIDLLIDIIVKPSQGLDFIYLSPPELFMAYIKIALLVGFTITSPITLIQIWLFVKPGLKVKERKYLLFSLLMGVVFFIVGVVFSYFTIIPITINFFVQVQVAQISPLFSFENYISFILSLLLSFGLVFELPLLISLLSMLNLVTTNTLKKYRKIVILVTFIVAAILTPPDVLSQTLMAIPMLFLYEFSILIATSIEKSKKLKNKE
jgi:sec-independent protein translocase protein TatC